MEWVILSVMTFTPLSILPTPLDEAPRLSAELGVRILIKRDDLTGLAMGGNKARKLDYLLRDAIEKGCDTSSPRAASSRTSPHDGRRLREARHEVPPRARRR